MAGEWTLIEYRPGRFAKISATGEFLGRASEAEAKAWFAAREAPLDALLHAESEPESPPPLPEPRQEVKDAPPATLEDEHDLWPAGDLADPPEAELPPPEPLAEPAALLVEERDREVEGAALEKPDAVPDPDHLTDEQPTADLFGQMPVAKPEVEAQAPDIEPESELPQDLVGKADQADQEPNALLVEERDREVEGAALEKPDAVPDPDHLTDEQPTADLFGQMPVAKPEVEAQAPDIEPESELPQDLVGKADQADQEPNALLVEERDREVERAVSEIPDAVPDPDLLTVEQPTVERVGQTPVAEPEVEVQAPGTEPVGDPPKDGVGELHKADQEPAAESVDAEVVSQSPASGTEDTPVVEKPAPDLVDAKAVARAVAIAPVEDETLETAPAPDPSGEKAEPSALDAEPDEDEPWEEEWVEEPLDLEFESQLSLPELGDIEEDLEEDEPIAPAPVKRKAQAASRRPTRKVEPEPEPEPCAPGNGVGRWLWVDPRQERGYNPGSFDVAGFLQRAVELFRSKEWTAGQSPGRLAVHPDQVTERLSPAAEAQNLEVVPDPMVPRGTYRLGLPDVHD